MSGCGHIKSSKECFDVMYITTTKIRLEASSPHLGDVSHWHMIAPKTIKETKNRWVTLHRQRFDGPVRKWWDGDDTRSVRRHQVNFIADRPLHGSALHSAQNTDGATGHSLLGPGFVPHVCIVWYVAAVAVPCNRGATKLELHISKLHAFPTGHV